MIKQIIILIILLSNTFLFSKNVTIHLDNRKEINIKNFDYFFLKENLVKTIYKNKLNKKIKVSSVESVIQFPLSKYKESIRIKANYLIPNNIFKQEEPILFSLDKLIEYSVNKKIKTNYFYHYKIFTLNIGNNELVKVKTNKVKVLINIDLINNIEIINTSNFNFYVYKPFLEDEYHKKFFEEYKKSAEKSYEYFKSIFNYTSFKKNNVIPVYLFPDITFHYTSAGLEDRGMFISISQLLPKDFDQSINYKIYDKYFYFSHELVHYFLFEFGCQPFWLLENLPNYFAIKCEYNKYPIKENQVDWNWVYSNANKFDKENISFINYDLINRRLIHDNYIHTIFKELEELCGEDIWAKTFKSMKEDNYKFYEYLSPNYNDYKKTQEFIEYIQKNTDKDIIGFFKEKGFKYKFKEKNK